MEANAIIHIMGMITPEDNSENVAQKASALAHAAWYQIIENHDVVVPVLAIDHGNSQEVIRDFEEIRSILLKEVAHGSYDTTAD